MTTTSTNGTDAKKDLYLAGINVMHSIAPPMHNHISKSLPLPWTFQSRECPDIPSTISLFRLPSFAGAVVTMPYKKSIIPFLDEVDPLVTLLGACNNVYLTPSGKLRGTNTDWRGIKGCLLSGTPSGSNEGNGKSALIIGAGGASRAAVYALFKELSCGEIYIINRDAGEVSDLLTDIQTYSPPPKITHITSTSQASSLKAPYYIVGTVPDFEAKTKEEIKARDILQVFLDKGKEEEKGVLLDMCFKPRNTRILKMGRERGWRCVEGTGVIGHQIEEQWRLWAGAELAESVKEEAWVVLRREAENSKGINF